MSRNSLLEAGTISDLEFMRQKIVMNEVWYDHEKPNYGEKAKLCYMDTDNFIV